MPAPPRVWRLEVVTRTGHEKTILRVARDEPQACTIALLTYPEVLAVEELPPGEQREVVDRARSVPPPRPQPAPRRAPSPEEAVLELLARGPRYASEVTSVLPCRLRAPIPRARFLDDLAARGLVTVVYRRAFWNQPPVPIYSLAPALVPEGAAR